ncbi:hypothetical protein [Natrinema ejinorense]|nr:hypothetical protein [Natrinema ejinorense]
MTSPLELVRPRSPDRRPSELLEIADGSDRVLVRDRPHPERLKGLTAN